MQNIYVNNQNQKNIYMFLKGVVSFFDFFINDYIFSFSKTMVQ